MNQGCQDPGGGPLDEPQVCDDVTGNLTWLPWVNKQTGVMLIVRDLAVDPVAKEKWRR